MGTHGAAVSEGARRGLGKVVERRQGVRPVGQVATGDHDHTRLALVRGPLPLWSHWEEKLAMPTVVQQRISVTPQGCRLRFSVTSQPQSALFLTWANVGPPHGKAHSGRWTSRKSAFCAHCLTEKRILPAHLTKRRILEPTGWAECAFP